MMNGQAIGAFMRKSGKPRNENLRHQIAAAAARIMAEDGVDDFALAKRKAARHIGAPDNQPLPGNEEVEVELRAYQALFQADEQRQRIAMLRRQALEVMRMLERFRPYLLGSVLAGTAGRYAEVDIVLFTDDNKAVELFLLNNGITYETSEQRSGPDYQKPIPVFKMSLHGTVFNLAVRTSLEERITLKTWPGGRTIDRADIADVARLVVDAA